MFDREALISFVFADEDDLYFQSDLRKLKLNQYLWEQLREQYNAVYFLARNEKTFRIWTWGEANDYRPKKKRFAFWRQEKPETWIRNQLCHPKKKVAFVCPLPDFCEVLGADNCKMLKSMLCNLEMRTGIFVLTASTIVENSRDYLLTSPVFEEMEEETVQSLRKGEPRSLYECLRRSKGKYCRFLNVFTTEHIRNLLSRVMAEKPERWMNAQQLDELSQFLNVYLRDQKMQWEAPVFTFQGYFNYKDIYEDLLKHDVWANMLEVSTKLKNCHTARIDNIAPVRHAYESYAERCMKLEVPLWYEASAKNACSERCISRLINIHNILAYPKNCEDCQLIVEKIGCYLDWIEELNNPSDWYLEDNKQKGDADTYELLLTALEFAVKRVHQKDTSKLQEVLRLIENGYVAYRGYYCRIRHNKPVPVAATDEYTLLSQQQVLTEHQLGSTECACKQLMDVIHAKIVEADHELAGGTYREQITPAMVAKIVRREENLVAHEIQKEQAASGGDAQEDERWRTDTMTPPHDA